jgi:predicted nuclease of predicted toxin-antitoxin system
MNILLDECTPRALKKRLPHLAIRTVQDMGWSGVKNGKLLALADQQFDVFITTDKNLRYQQNLAQLKLAIVLLPTNRVRVVITLIPKIEEVLKTIQSGDFIEIAMPLNSVPFLRLSTFARFGQPPPITSTTNSVALELCAKSSAVI